MEFSAFVSLLADVTFVAFIGIFVAAAGLFFFDRPNRQESSKVLMLHEHERHAA